MTILLTVLALHFGPVFRLGAVTRKVAYLLAVTAGDSLGVARLIALLRNVVFRAAVTAGSRRTRFDIGALRLSA